MATKKTSVGFSTTLDSLKAAEAKVAALRQRASKERTGILEGLHLRLGFAARRELIDALTSLDGSKEADQPAAAGRRRRARLTPELRTRMIAALKNGHTGGAIAKHYGVSIQTVQNVKKAAGLVQARKKAASA